MLKTAHIIRHVDFEDLGSLQSVLVEHGYQITYFAAGVDDLLLLKQTPADLVIALGGPVSVNQAQLYPFINDEIAVLRHRIELNLPTLGICLGAQMLAAAAGAKIVKNSQFEIGWSKLELAQLAGHDYFKHLNNVAVLHWHGDTFELPAQASRHASTELCVNQAFSLGNRILGLQFHPEVTAEGMEKWLIANAQVISDVTSISLDELVEQTEKYAEQLEQSAKRFWSAWLKSWQAAV